MLYRNEWFRYLLYHCFSFSYEWRCHKQIHLFTEFEKGKNHIAEAMSFATTRVIQMNVTHACRFRQKRSFGNFSDQLQGDEFPVDRTHYINKVKVRIV